MIIYSLILSGLLLDSQTESRLVRRPNPLLYTVAREYHPMSWVTGGERFPRGATLFIRDGKTPRPLAPGLAASADANVSFDAKSVLFAGQQHSGDHWQVWEISLQTNGPRQLTHCEDDCVRPLYVPPDRFVYAHKVAGKFVLEIASLGDREQKAVQLTYGPGNFLPTDVLRDGRVLLEAGYPLGDSTSAELYTVYTDGSGVESYRCDHGYSRHSGKQVSSGDIVFVREGRLARFTSALAHEVMIPAPGGTYAGDVIEVQGGEWLVSWRSKGQEHFELRKWKPGAATLQPEIATPGGNVVQPVLVTERAVPNRHPSALHPWVYANVLCLNAYTSKQRFAENSIAYVRLYTRAASGAPQALGMAPVEKDGSFYLRVPGDKPLKIELLDESGNTLKKEAGWFWMRGGEQRVCVGCHAGPETAPENAVPAVLRRSIVPADMIPGNQRSSAGAH